MTAKCGFTWPLEDPNEEDKREGHAHRCIAEPHDPTNAHHCRCGLRCLPRFYWSAEPGTWGTRWWLVKDRTVRGPYHSVSRHKSPAAAEKGVRAAERRATRSGELLTYSYDAP